MIRVLLTTTAIVAALMGAAVFAVVRVLAPQPGEWSAPLPLAGKTVIVGVPGLLRLTTSLWVGPLLDGRRFVTRFGPVRLTWERATGTLAAECAPCSVHLTALGPEPVRAARLTLRVRRDFNALSGTLEAASDRPAIHATWHGTLGQQSLDVQADVAAAPIADWYAALLPALPERDRAVIAGTLALRVQASLPGGKVSTQAVVSGFAVSGLGTQQLAHARSACGPASGLANDSWLARAVIAAEDQRFAEHPGYDIAEMAVAFGSNQQRGAELRGASTLTQQLAKLLVTGSERSAGRKLRELLYAVEMERTLGKTGVLQLYMDNAPWGEGVCGAEAAARHYFGVRARALTPRQAVWLASMLHAPDRAARAWSRDGSIDIERALWVAQGVRGVRGIGQRQRRALVEALARPMPRGS